MKVDKIFDALLENLKVGDASTTVAARRGEITKALNKDFRSVEGSTANRVMVGSYGRHTAIRGVSDLDMIYILPASLRSSYSTETGPRRMLNRVRDDLTARYPNTDIRVDQCVVRVQFTSNKFKFEVQPAFENSDGSFDYPDTKAEGWKVTKPREEIAATKDCNDRTSTNMRHLARMARAWKDTNGVVIGGLLIDTLVYRFFSATSEYDDKGSLWFDFMVRDFFEFLMSEPNKDYYLALGSNQRVNVKKRFQPKAEKAYNLCIEAIAKEGKASANKKWREVFGSAVPLEVTESARSFKDTEEFIESRYPINVSESLAIDCNVTQNGWRTASLREMLKNKTLLLPNKELDFTITECSVSYPYDVKWKVLNCGNEAERRNNIRGEIISPNRAGNARHERTSFRGKHVVECYIIKDGIVVARDVIDVPICTNAA
ncbi:nucleotide-binding domain-containing protein [Amycolatopsis albispora]|uniref:Nucleotidyltransferase n=1 Tax=Amycolatopsis albispora TaxID=1804986 RepID=A0A344LE17_9PSEU|nr:nucleotidyltransferase [Amycolatopsis albispora]AXB46291.1 nucleotidyltransferase [Amycolatopsis albispora]